MRVSTDVRPAAQRGRRPDRRPSPRVRFQLAFTLGEPGASAPELASAPWRSSPRNDDDTWTQTAVLSSAARQRRRPAARPGPRRRVHSRSRAGPARDARPRWPPWPVPRPTTRHWPRPRSAWRAGSVSDRSSRGRSPFWKAWARVCRTARGRSPSSGTTAARAQGRRRPRLRPLRPGGDDGARRQAARRRARRRRCSCSARVRSRRWPTPRRTACTRRRRRRCSWPPSAPWSARPPEGRQAAAGRVAGYSPTVRREVVEALFARPSAWPHC